MKKIINIIEMRQLLKSEQVIETQNCFVYRKREKYFPSITFVLDKEMYSDAFGYIVNPLDYRKAVPAIQEMGYDFHGTPEFLFGKFWVSEKHGNCFRVQDPQDASHLLIRVDWGGAFNRTRGITREDAKWQAKNKLVHFEKRSSNGGGAGNDFWVISLWDKASPLKGAETIVSEYSALFADEREKADILWKERLAKRESSRLHKGECLPRLLKMKKALGQAGIGNVLSLDDTSYTYNGIAYLYTDKNVDETESLVQHRLVVAEKDVKAKQMADADREKYEPLFYKGLSAFMQSGFLFPRFEYFVGRDFWEMELYKTGSTEKFSMNQEGYKAFMEKAKALQKELAEKGKREELAREQALNI